MLCSSLRGLKDRMVEKIAIASDHAGVELKETIKSYLLDRGFDVLDMGTDHGRKVDYPDVCIPVALKVSSGEIKRAILLCGTGIGMSIVANKFTNVRAALVSDLYTARMAKEHNNANILVIGGRIIEKDAAVEMVGVWLDSQFQGGRHQRRLDKIAEVERQF